jgi:hypothetical protein
VDSLADAVGMPRFALTAPETMQVFSSRNMTLPRSYPLTRSATLTAEWCKARRLHSIVWLVKSSPLKKLFLGGGPPFGELQPELALRLYEKFTPVVEELEALLNRDLSAWKSPGFAPPQNGRDCLTPAYPRQIEATRRSFLQASTDTVLLHGKHCLRIFPGDDREEPNRAVGGRTTAGTCTKLRIAP